MAVVAEGAPLPAFWLRTSGYRNPRRFLLVRSVDETGVSGTGVVATGVEFVDGVAVMRWCSVAAPNSTAVYDSIDELERIHGHEGKTRVEWIDP